MIEILEYCKNKREDAHGTSLAASNNGIHPAYWNGKAAAYTEVIDQLRYLANKILEKGNN